ncbi:MULTISPECIES: TrmH family RNA methyltransferase [Flavobacteriaceae]|uniref:RNA methyltransferase n=2 Tax=Flavobacteriaceae TaxID=49546 RepID=A0A4Y8AUJ4_9FLAO|nr:MULTISPECIES: RNA methyltransferase [Flavobacteriaceae]TEW75153.1 RNA methyltransferase [Gramella jeungdoensis]GGK41179.1 RNA methyltransferase [Lutibacter litoralis]
MSLSKNQLKLITSLRKKKYRIATNLFIVEGIKVVNEFLNSTFELEQLFCVDATEYINYKNKTIIPQSDLKKISNLITPNNVLAIFKIPTANFIEKEGLVLALDEINDPGNLGTIIRLCDWFGIDQLICSKDTVDCYNAKVVQASMGSLTRVSIFYTDLKVYLKSTNKPTYASLMNGDNLYKTVLPTNAVLVMGNEANGISKPVLELLENAVSIPRFGNLQQTESLNVATATAILLSEFKRGN